MLCHKTDLNKLKKIETILSILSDHNEMKLEINNRRKKKNWRIYKYMEIKQHILEQPIDQRRNQKRSYKIS